jgi:hypothetical protein
MGCYRNRRRASWTLGERRSFRSETGATRLPASLPFGGSLASRQTQRGSFVQLAQFTIDGSGLL